MIRITVMPRGRENLYGLLVKKEQALRKKRAGTLHRYALKQKGKEKWQHDRYPGWLWFQRCLGGMLVGCIQAKNEGAEWQLLSSFITFMDRYFRDSISSINISYEDED